MIDELPPDRPARREPIFNLPGVIIACCAVLCAIYALYSFASDQQQDRILAAFAFVPARAAIALGVAHGQLRAALTDVSQEEFVALIGDGGGRWWTLVTYAFLHGSWAHVGFNCLWLVVFGAPVARRFAPFRFVALLVVTAIIGALVQFLAGMASFVPVIGASAAVSGAMGAAVRFVFRPADEPGALFERRDAAAAFRQPALSLVQTVRTKTAVLFILFWFVTNLLFGLFPSLSGVTDGPIAWQAHIGGFVAGLLLFPLFDPRRPETLPTQASAEAPIEGDELSRES